jgi:WhiB family redox-sensing transcriptional regulator
MISGLLHVPTFVLDGDPACANVDPELFFPQEIEVGNNRIMSVYGDIATAKSICNTCPLKAPCLEYALNNSEVGVWGGTTEHQRDDLRRIAKIRIVRRSNNPLYR